MFRLTIQITMVIKFFNPKNVSRNFLKDSKIIKLKYLIAVYVISSTLFIFGVILTFYDYSYRGYYSDKIINWIWLLLNFLIIIIYWKKKFVKISLLIVVLFLSLSIIPMGIPFFGKVYYFSTIDDYQQIKLNENYRIERTRQNALSMPRIYIFQDKGILEKNICRTKYQEIIQKIEKKNSYSSDIDERTTQIQQAKLISINKDSLGIEYKILNKKGIFYHKFEDDGY